MQVKRLLVTGGAGFIGSAFIRETLTSHAKVECVVNLDLLTYAANLESLKEVDADPRYTFVQGDICDRALVERLIEEHKIDTIVHFAAESHVDNSIEAPHVFYETNVGGTIVLLEAVRKYSHIHFHHVSTDEVYGSLEDDGVFTEESRYNPSSPYAASKASSDHFVRAYARTYSLSTTISHCTNNYGPFQHREKLIPRMIACCLKGETLPVYGTGKQVRDWLYVDDHVKGIWAVLEKGQPGETYAFGGGEEKRNIDLVHLIIQEVAKQTGKELANLEKLITHVIDRLGHDYRYAIDPAKVKRELGWTPSTTLEQGLREIVRQSLREG